VSRAGAAFGSAVGLALGGAFGGYTVLSLKQGRVTDKTLFDGAVVGAFVGTIIGAALGAGPKEPAQVGTGHPLTPRFP